MPTRQTAAATTSPCSSMPAQQPSSTTNNNGAESNHRNFVLENAATLNYGRMRMPSGALRDVDELVNEIKLNLRLKSNGGGGCCGELAGSSSSGGAGVCGGGAHSCGDNEGCSAGGKTKQAKNCRGLARIHSAPYNLHQCSGAQDKNEGFHSLETWQRRHHLQPLSSAASRSASSNPDDPYVLLQELLQEGGLIKEAVRRINFVQDEQSEERGKCFDYEKDEYETSSQIVPFLPTLGL